MEHKELAKLLKKEIEKGKLYLASSVDGPLQLCIRKGKKVDLDKDIWLDIDTKHTEYLC